MLTELDMGEAFVSRPLHVNLAEIVAVRKSESLSGSIFWIKGEDGEFGCALPAEDLLKLVNEAQGEHGDVRLQLEGLRARVESQDAMIQVLLDTQTNACTAMKALKELAAQNQGRIADLEKSPVDIKRLAGEVGMEMFRQAEANAEKLEKQKEKP